MHWVQVGMTTARKHPDEQVPSVYDDGEQVQFSKLTLEVLKHGFVVSGGVCAGDCCIES